MSLKLSPDLAAILRGVVEARRPDLIHLLDSSATLAAKERQALRQALADELAATGLRDDDEPNERGHLLEELIDKLGSL